MFGLACGRKQVLFAALSLTDLALTRLLLWRGGGLACESNPVAAWWLERFGWAGLAGFKVAIVLLVGALTAVVSWHHPRAGRRLLAFGCSALLAVVLYSASLVYWVEAGPASAAAATIRQYRESIQDLEQDAIRARAYDALLGRLAGDLAEQRRSLAEAVAALAQAEYVKDPRWLRRRQSGQPGCRKDECLARTLALHTLDLVRADPYRSEQVYRDLEAQFRTNFGRPAPFRPGDPGLWVASFPPSG
jgi:hypothetical protein